MRKFSKLSVNLYQTYSNHNLTYFNRIERKRREKEEQETYKLEQKIALWDPQSNPEGTTDPFRTLFVSRINFYTSESKLRREFESYGPIKQIKMISDQKTGKPRGYCFIEFEQEKDMHCKYFFSKSMLLLFTEVLKTSSGELYNYSNNFANVGVLNRYNFLS